MKKYLLAIAMFCAFLAQPVFANEGRITGKNGTVTCEGVSVWDNVSYKIFGRCQGLTYPFAERLDRYSIWVVPDNGSTPKRVGEVNKGLFDVRSDERFSHVLISAEEGSNPRVPSSTVVVDAAVQAYDFSEGVIQPVITPVVEDSLDQNITPTPVQETKSTGRNFLTGPNAPPLNVILLGMLAAIVLAIILFLRR